MGDNLHLDGGRKSIHDDRSSGVLWVCAPRNERDVAAASRRTQGRAHGQRREHRAAASQTAMARTYAPNGLVV